MMQSVVDFYTERVMEIDSFLNLIETIQVASQGGPPQIGDGGEITADHQKILVSTAYIQLYSLLESTMGQAFEYIAKYVSQNCLFQDLNDAFKREWTDFQVKIHSTGVSSDKRSELALRMSKNLIEMQTLAEFRIDKRNAKGWDRKVVDDLSGRIGVSIDLSNKLDQDLRIHYSNDMPPLTFLKIRRGQLAHGDISFTQSGDIKSIDDLRRLRDLTCAYLDSVLNSFRSFLNVQGYRRVETNDELTNAATGSSAANLTG